MKYVYLINTSKGITVSVYINKNKAEEFLSYWNKGNSKPLKIKQMRTN